MKKKLLILLLILSFSLTLLACASQEELETTTELESGKTEVIRLAGFNGGYPSPFAHYPRQRGHVMKLVFDSLLEKGEKGYIPWLAADWEISEDGKTYIFDLRQGAKWHDGEVLTARDVVFSLEYYQEHPPIFVGERVVDADFLLEVEAISDYQVKIITAEADATFLGEVGFLRVIPEHIWKGVESPRDYNAQEAVIGSGPYTLVNYSQEHNTYQLKAFEEYWGPEIMVERIEYVPVSEEVMAFERGEIDIIQSPPDLLDRFKNDPKYKVVQSPALAAEVLNFNLAANELFQDRKFRQAIAYAIDQQDIIDKVARGAAKKGSAGILPEDHNWYNRELRQYEYNSEKANKLLDELGRNDLSFELLVDSDSGVRIGEVIKEHLSEVGIEIDLVAVESRTRDSRVYDSQYEMALVATGSWGLDPDYLRMRFSSEIGAGAGGSATAMLGAAQSYEHSEVDRLSREQLAELDENKRKELIFELQALLAEEVPEIPLYNNFRYFIYRPQKYDGWRFKFDHPVMNHAKISYLEEFLEVE